MVREEEILLRQSCIARNSASVVWSQICCKTNILGTKTTLHLEVNLFSAKWFIIIITTHRAPSLSGVAESY